MMTHDEIEGAIGKLRELMACSNRTTGIEVVCAIVGYLNIGDACDKLIGLLEQADPDTHMELPKDADGEVIRVGDEMERGSKRGRVVALTLSNYPKKWNGGRLHWGVQLEGERIPTALDSFFHHYHKPTVEDLLREMIDKAGCRHYQDGSCEMGLTYEQIAEYAAKLREVMGNDDAR